MTSHADTTTLQRDRLADDLDVARDRVLAGPNRWRREPAITGDVLPGALLAHPELLAEALDMLRAELPGLPELPTPPASAPTDGAGWAHLLATLALALQRAAGSDVGPWLRVGGGDEADSWAFAIGYEEEGVGIAAVRAAARMLRRVLRGERADVASVVGDLRDRHDREALAPTPRAIVAEARRRGIPVRRSPDDAVVQLGLGCRLHRIEGIRTDRTSVIGADIAGDRERTLDVLARLGVPVPRRDDPPARGNVHRVLVVAGRVVAVAERVPAGPGAEGERTIDRTDALHPENAAICTFAADAVGLDVAGIDVVATDVAVPFRESRATVMGMTARPAVRLHTHPDEGTARDVPAAILDALFPPGTPSRIPLVAVTGTNGKTTTTRLVAHLLRQAGHRVGFTTTDGVYHGERLIFAGDMTGPMAADMVLSNPRIDAAVLETARGGILRAGLGFDACDVGVVLNVTADHLGLRGIHTVEQLAEVKAVIVSAVRPDGHAVLNADDPLVYAMRERTTAHPVLFTLGTLVGTANVTAHVEAGGMAVTVERDAGSGGAETLVLHRGSARTPLVGVADVPLTEGGAARFQLQNVAAASGAAWAAGIAPDVIRAGLRSFVPSAATTPGRMNVLKLRDATIIVDYAHNPAAIRALLDYASRLEAGRRIAVLSTPGDRRDADIREMGAFGAAVDIPVFMETPAYRRGRPSGDNTRLLLEGLVAAGGDATRAVPVVGQDEAVRAVLRLLQPQDLVLFIADDAALVIAGLEAGAGRDVTG